MKIQTAILISSFLLLTAAAKNEVPKFDNTEEKELKGKKKLPADFKWGAATAAYQIEGAWNVDGRGESVWDHFTHEYPMNVQSGDRSNKYSTNGDIACDSYNKFEEDLKLLKIMNAKYYRFSLSWVRLFPDGQAKKDKDGKWNVNEKGAEYYDNIINTLLKNDIQPFVTIFHYDTPYALHQKYGGWLDYHSEDDFANYAEFCFERYGDRVKNWITINEPWCVCVAGYSFGPSKAPFRCQMEPPRRLSNDTTLDKKGGCTYEIGPTQYAKDKETLPADRPPQRLEDVWCSHHIILGHAKAVKIYRDKFQKEQNGIIGFSVDGDASIPWNEPGISDEEIKNNEKYANLNMEFRIGWYTDPPVTGDYPESVKKRLGKDLPAFTEEEKALLKGSTDFIGWNSYTTHWASQAKDQSGNLINPPTDEEASYENAKKDLWSGNCRGRGADFSCISPTLGAQTGSSWNFMYPPTLRVGLNWYSKRYEGLLKNGILITENGCAQPNYKVNRTNDEITKKYFDSIGEPENACTYDDKMVEKENDIEGLIMHDEFRINWYRQYLKSLRLAFAEDNVDINGYFAWSLMDNFEWENGYETRFGMAYIDFYKDKDLVRKPKDSLYFLGQWYLDNVDQNGKETSDASRVTISFISIAVALLILLL